MSKDKVEDNIELDDRAESHDEKKITSSQHSKIKRNMANQLRTQIDSLIIKQDKAIVEARKSYQEHKFWKSQGNTTEAEFHWQSYRTWSDENHRLSQEIQAKLKAVQKYESPSKKKKEEP